MNDSERIDWLEKMMTPDNDFCEIYFAGLRNWSGKATSFQVESNPQHFKAVNAPSLREAIDKAILNSRGF